MFCRTKSEWANTTCRALNSQLLCCESAKCSFLGQTSCTSCTGTSHLHAGKILRRECSSSSASHVHNPHIERNFCATCHADMDGMSHIPTSIVHEGSHCRERIFASPCHDGIPSIACNQILSCHVGNHNTSGKPFGPCHAGMACNASIPIASCHARIFFGPLSHHHFQSLASAHPS